MINTKLCKELYAGSFSLSTEMLMYLPMQKNSPWACQFLQCSSLLDSGKIHIHRPISSSLTAQHLAIWFYTALWCNSSQWAPSSQTEWFFFFPQAASLFLLCLCSIYTIEQPFLDSVSSLQDVFLAVTESNHITLT